MFYLISMLVTGSLGWLGREGKGGGERGKRGTGDKSGNSRVEVRDGGEETSLIITKPQSNFPRGRERDAKTNLYFFAVVFVIYLLSSFSNNLLYFTLLNLLYFTLLHLICFALLYFLLLTI